MKKLLLVAVLACALLIPAAKSNAEPYVSALVGAAIPHDGEITWLPSSPGFPGTADLEFEPGFSFGLRT
ncbi:MAG: hypothetical protein V3T30_01420, partial [Thermodesulfobacteriota bacterium]